MSIDADPYVVGAFEYAGVLYAEIDSLGPEVLDLLAEGGLGPAGPIGPQGPIGATGPAGPAYAPADGSIPLAKLGQDPLARSNHTGTQLAASISDFNAAVRVSKPEELAASAATLVLAQGVRLATAVKLLADAPTTYPQGLSQSAVINANGWPSDGVVLTNAMQTGNTYSVQVHISRFGGTMSFRNSSDGATWSTWQTVETLEATQTVSGIRTYSQAVQAIAGVYMRVANGKLNADAPSTYPLGTSTATVTIGNGFPVNGACITHRHEGGVYTTQLLTSQASTPTTYVRSSGDNTTWTGWAKLISSLDQPLGAWTAFTPTWTGITIGDGTSDCTYYQVGKLVVARYKFTFGSTSAITATPTPTLPVNASAGSSLAAMNAAVFRDVSAATNYAGLLHIGSTTQAQFSQLGRALANDALSGISSTVPFTWAVTDILGGTITYEAA